MCLPASATPSAIRSLLILISNCSNDKLGKLSMTSDHAINGDAVIGICGAEATGAGIAADHKLLCLICLPKR